MDSLADIQSRHRKEQKELQSRITQKKKNASKKTRKGVNSECDALEQQLKAQQEQELRAFDGQGDDSGGVEVDLEAEGREGNGRQGDEKSDKVNGDGDGDGLSHDLKAVKLSDTTTQDQEEEDSATPNARPKRNRQKERLARRAAETEAAIEAAREEAANQPDDRAVEHDRIHAEVKKEGLTEKLIRPDGHCLFSAVADQLSQIDVPLSKEAWSGDGAEGEGYKVVRRAAATYIENHPDDFAAWLEEPLQQYVRKIRDTAEWGGHLELLALASTYQVEICVIQDGARQVIEPQEGRAGEEGKKKRIWLAYYRHGFGLGEHYNSLRKLHS